MEDDSERRYNEMKEDFLSQCNNKYKKDKYYHVFELLANTLKDLPIKNSYICINDFSYEDEDGFVSIDVGFEYGITSCIAMNPKEDANEAMYSLKYKGDIIVMNTIDLYDYPKMINEIINDIKKMNYGRE